MRYTERLEWVRDVAAKLPVGAPLTASQIDKMVPIGGGAIAIGRTISPLFRELSERVEVDGTRVRCLSVQGFKITRFERDAEGANTSGQLHRVYVVEESR